MLPAMMKAFVFALVGMGKNALSHLRFCSIFLSYEYMRVFMLESLKAAAEFMCNLFQRQIEKTHRAGWFMSISVTNTTCHPHTVMVTLADGAFNSMYISFTNEWLKYI